jgi:hypothetical protein
MTYLFVLLFDSFHAENEVSRLESLTFQRFFWKEISTSFFLPLIDILDMSKHPMIIFPKPRKQLEFYTYKIVLLLVFIHY